MQEFTIGQRWINDAELQMGLGTVIEVETRTVTILFESIGEPRTYARQSAPLTRIAFTPGDTIHSRGGLETVVISVSENDGLLTYMARDRHGQIHEIDEILLDKQIQLNRPSERLFSARIDSNKWFTLRYQTLRELHRLGHSALRGLSGCRTSLIPHQLYIAHEVATRFAPRVLLADEVGLGKTIEAGLILHQQLLGERAQRVLIIVPESLVHQWLVEMLRRFNLHFSIFDEERYNTAIEYDEAQNPFHNEQLVLCSLAFLTTNPAIHAHALAGDWDLMVVDEAHHLEWSPGAASSEYQAIDQLARVTAGVLLLTATPEQLGKAGHFARLRLLDPTRFPDFDAFIEEESRYEPVANAIEALLGDDRLDAQTLDTLAGTIDEADNRVLLDRMRTGSIGSDELARTRHALVEHLLDRHGTGRVLFRNTRATVSGFPGREVCVCPLPLPEAYRDLPPAPTIDMQLRPELLYSGSGSQAHWSEFDPRVDWLQKTLRALKPARVLVIAASARTALELAEALRLSAGMYMAVFHEGMSIIERDRAAAYFADQEEGCQALICSEIGSEGRNFQFAHHLVLFDLPLNPDLLEQRIGRLDRIGQDRTINIHVPYLQDSAQELMFRWHHLGLNAFELPCPAGATVYKQMQDRLLAALSAPREPVDDLLAETRARLQSLDEALHRGRDRLLEYNSCRPDRALALKEQAEQEDRQSTLAQYMDAIFDCFGVHTEEHSSDRYIISPGENMLTAFPHLQEDGMTVTYSRELALSNEDVHFLTWDHPMTVTAMDMVLGSELGNTAVIAIEYDKLEPGTLLLESIYLFESASSHSLNTQRYLPPSTIRIIIDSEGGHHEKHLDHNVIEQCTLPVDRDTATKIISARLDDLKQMTKQSGQQAQKLAPAMLAEAHAHAARLLTQEIDRLKALSRVNRNVRGEEIAYFEQQREALDIALDNASLRLDALRVIIST